MFLATLACTVQYVQAFLGQQQLDKYQLDLVFLQAKKSAARKSKRKTAGKGFAKQVVKLAVEEPVAETPDATSGKPATP